MLNVKQEYLDELSQIFKNYCPKAEIWAYGSRLDGDSHSGSDLDMTVKSFNEEGKYLYELKTLLIDSDIPFLMDINEFNKLPESFQKEILKNIFRSQGIVPVTYAERYQIDSDLEDIKAYNLGIKSENDMLRMR